MLNFSSYIKPIYIKLLTGGVLIILSVTYYSLAKDLYYEVMYGTGSYYYFNVVGKLFLLLLTCGSGLLVYGMALSPFIRSLRVSKKGVEAPARILALRNTSTMVNYRPVVAVELAVYPSDRSAFRVVVEEVFSQIGAAQLIVGMNVTVKYDKKNPTDAIIARYDSNVAADSLRVSVNELPLLCRRRMWAAMTVLLMGAGTLGLIGTAVTQWYVFDRPREQYYLEVQKNNRLQEDLKKEGVAAQGKVISVTEKKRNPSGGLAIYKVSVEINASSPSFTVEAEVIGLDEKNENNFTEGKTVKVLYDPQNLNRAIIVP